MVKDKKPELYAFFPQMAEFIKLATENDQGLCKILSSLRVYHLSQMLFIIQYKSLLE